MRRLKLAVALAMGAALVGSAANAQIQASKEQIQYWTSKWTGERFADGRPKVSDDLMKRMELVSLEEAWGTMRRLGYNNQFEGDWIHIDTDDVKPIIGRALTVQYMPLRPDMRDPMAAQAAQEKRLGPHNTWPIEQLQPGDVYVADSYGKVADGTLIGDRLGNGIYAKSKNGVVFYGSVRDEEGLRAIPGFNGLVKGFHPSAIAEMQMAGINPPIRIGAATVLPGDVVLAKRGGVIFIPAILAEQVVLDSEFVRMTDAFAFAMVQEGRYTAGQMDQPLTPAMKQDFRRWLQADPRRVVVPRDRLEAILTQRGY
jgi:4-hydroxy-4-methyl-2-oxoglutarate aldolase